MFNALRIFAPPKFPVLSLEVQAHLPVVEAQEQSQFRLLVRHFLERFFNNDMVSADGETEARLLQVAYAIALPGIVVALFLVPSYHAPLERPFWSQVSDHYFYVLYSFVAVGAVSIFSWDLLFPDLLAIDAFPRSQEKKRACMNQPRLRDTDCLIRRPLETPETALADRAG